LPSLVIQRADLISLLLEQFERLPAPTIPPDCTCYSHYVCAWEDASASHVIRAEFADCNDVRLRALEVVDPDELLGCVPREKTESTLAPGREQNGIDELGWEARSTAPFSESKIDTFGLVATELWPDLSIIYHEKDKKLGTYVTSAVKEERDESLLA
jgi:hypothetical protein